ncbi:MAG: hypothetical protein GWN18_00025 [Thermoplasmata archaeon]|nr:hypothetical protein [Thermoplasmata archaeon]NIS10351.1 hypothetical protein [Thermoplasmata archaeon]NIT75318.1 hypothetical protein [Thermoplasmata archaeon]NIU47499.1 hypothetical protein [Thermoplasmata archaeon]NIV77155.1 hypothetical protein [Thermoplasmata archaeon]
MKYHFLPWTDIESYRWKEKGSLGRVLTLGRGAFSCFLLPSMREFDLVYPVILKNLTLVGN